MAYKRANNSSDPPEYPVSTLCLSNTPEMSSSLPTGFHNFPVSKYLIFATIGLPIVAALTSTKYVYVYAYTPFIDEFHQLWRLLTFQIAFINESEVLLGTILLYQFRSLERLFSSHRYLSLVIVIYVYVVFAATLIATFKFYTSVTWMNAVSSGPTAVLFSLLAQYREYIPVMYRFEIHGPNQHKLVLTDQFFIFLLGFQLAITQGLRSISSALLGWVLGDLVLRGVLPGKSWRIPFWKKLTGSREETPVPSTLRQDEEDEAATETRPLATQFLDTFRR